MTSGEKLQFDSESNEVIVSYALSAEQQKPNPLPPSGNDIPVNPLRAEDLPAEISLDDFPGTPAEKQEAFQIFTSYADVLSREENSLGRTTMIQHQIPNCENIP